MKELMIHVERTVRPICAEQIKKCRMREELYAHILGIYELEREGGADEKTALASACQRFGQPSELTVELQETVPRLARAFAFIEGLTLRRTEESAVRHSCRMTGYYTILFAALCTFAIGVDYLLVGRAFKSAIQLQIVFAIGLFFITNIFIFTLIGHAMCRQFEAGLLRPRSWLVSGGLCALAALTTLGTGWGFLLLLPLDSSTVSEFLPRWFVFAGFVSAGFVAVARFVALEAERSRPWNSLSIED